MKKRLILPLFTSLTLSLSALAQTPDQGNEADKWLPNLTSVTSIDESTIKVRMVEAEVQSLYDRFAAHYGGFIKGAKTKTVDFEFIMSADNSKAAFELDYLFGLAMDEGLPLAQFADFGFEPDGDGGFHYDMEASPHLALPRKLFRRLVRKFSMEILSKQLLRKGFRQSDIVILQDYVDNNDLESIKLEHTLALAKNKLPTIKHMVTAKTSFADYQDYFQAWAYQKRYVNYNAWRNWGLGLLAKLDTQRQLILKQLLVESLSGNTARGPSSKAHMAQTISLWEGDVISGKLEQEMIQMSNDLQTNLKTREDF